MNFRKNLKENRKRAGLSQEEVADRLSVSRQTISKWESGDSYPSTQHILMIAKYLDCSMDDLIGNSNPPSNHNIKASLFHRISFIRILVTSGIVIVSILFGFCIASVNQARNDTSSQLAIRNDMMKSDLFNMITGSFLDDIFGAENKDSKKTILGYGVSIEKNTFYIKCGLCKDDIPTAAIVYLYKNESGYSYECEFLDDFNYCPGGEYHSII